jgi:dihydrofolate reductase
VTRLVADASAIVDLLAGAPNAGTIAAALAPFPELDVPEHFHVEAISALRGLLLRGDLAADRGERALLSRRSHLGRRAMISRRATGLRYRSPIVGQTEQGAAMQIILTDFMSLDGVVQAPGGPDEDTDGGFAHGGWSMKYFDPDVMGPVVSELIDRSDALLFGRRTWQGMAAAWPGRAGDPYADRMNAIPKYVASRTLSEDDLTWSGSTLLPADDAIGAIRELRARDGRGLQIWGSTSLAAQLVEHDLVDEYVLMIEPILLGGGKRVFPEDGRARPLELVSTTTAGTGVLICSYRPALP